MLAVKRCVIQYNQRSTCLYSFSSFGFAAPFFGIAFSGSLLSLLPRRLNFSGKSCLASSEECWGCCLATEASFDNGEEKEKGSPTTGGGWVRPWRLPWGPVRKAAAERWPAELQCDGVGRGQLLVFVFECQGVMKIAPVHLLGRFETK